MDPDNYLYQFVASNQSTEILSEENYNLRME